MHTAVLLVTYYLLKGKGPTLHARAQLCTGLPKLARFKSRYAPKGSTAFGGVSLEEVLIVYSCHC